MKKHQCFLIVEDDPAIRMIHRDFLTELVPDCVIYEAENAAQGICLYFEHQPYMVMLDMLMPYMGGKTFLDVLEEGILSNILTKKPRIIVITSIEDIKELMGIGKRFAVEAVISKPISQKQLSILLKSHL
ncbi:Signal transduction response regulator, receiver region domain protein [Candidatus Magnetomoraceae bacterium gMMP-15]